VFQRQFGVSTRLYRNQRLTRDHVFEIAAHGFETVELFAAQTHLDYHNPSVIADLQQWLAEARVELHGVHAPVSDPSASRPGEYRSIASADTKARGQAMAEVERALQIARRIPMKVFVLHLGWPRTHKGFGGSNRDAARRSVEELFEIAEPLGVRLAVEVIPNDLSRPGSLVDFAEEDMESGEIGICLDFGHAHLEGDLVDAIEIVSGHLASIHVHDNHGRADDHLVPFEGTIDWPAALTAVQKVGYDGALIFELAARGSTRETLVRARAARRRMESLVQTEASGQREKG
jgi:sugar phosphate isomerase/epimerase